MVDEIIKLYLNLSNKEVHNEEAPTVELIKACAKKIVPEFIDDVNYLLEHPLTVYTIPANIEILSGTIVELLMIPRQYDSAQQFMDVLLETNGPAMNFNQMYNELITTFYIESILPPPTIKRLLAVDVFNPEILMVTIILYTIPQI